MSKFIFKLLIYLSINFKFNFFHNFLHSQSTKHFSILKGEIYSKISYVICKVLLTNVEVARTLVLTIRQNIYLQIV